MTDTPETPPVSTRKKKVIVSETSTERTSVEGTPVPAGRTSLPATERLPPGDVTEVVLVNLPKLQHVYNHWPIIKVLEFYPDGSLMKVEYDWVTVTRR